MAHINTYDVGDSPVLTATFRDRDTELKDPTTVVCRVLPPSGTEQNPSPAQVSTGVYEAVITIDEPGVWHYRFEGTGAVEAAGDHKFKVRETQFST